MAGPTRPAPGTANQGWRRPASRGFEAPRTRARPWSLSATFSAPRVCPQSMSDVVRCGRGRAAADVPGNRRSVAAAGVAKAQEKRQDEVDEDQQQADVHHVIADARGQPIRTSPGKASTTYSADPTMRVATPRLTSRRRAARSRPVTPKSDAVPAAMNGSCASRNSRNSIARCSRTPPAYSRSTVEARVEEGHSLLPDELPEEAQHVPRQVVMGGQLMAQRAERHQHLEIGNEAGRQRQIVLADGAHDVDGQPQVRIVGDVVRAAARDLEGGRLAYRVVEEGLMDADELPSCNLATGVPRRERASASAPRRPTRPHP